MIVITGATGTVGRELAAQLTEAGEHVRALVRDADRARALLGPSVELVVGDFASSKDAFVGADAAMLVAPAGPTQPEHDLALVRALAESTVARIVKLSAFGAEEDNGLASSAWHGPGERAVMAAGRQWTILRPAGFASNARAWLPQMRAGTPIAIATGEGRHAVVDPRDVASVAAVALRGTSAVLANAGVTLTGPEPLTGAEQVAILARVLGRPLAVDGITPEVAVERMRASGVPAVFADSVLGGFRFVRDGHAAARTDVIERVLGRPPHSFESWVRDHAALFV